MDKTTATLAATVRDNGEGEQRWFCGGGVFTWKATAQETGGAFLIFEDDLDGGKVTRCTCTPRRTRRSTCSKARSILLHIDGHERRLGAGGIAILPRGVPHAYVVTSPKARMLCLQTPGSGEAFYLDASEPVSHDAPGGVVDFDRMRAAAARTGAIEIVGPPPFTQP